MRLEIARPGRGGFTMIELLIVIAIITILAAGLTVAVAGVIDRTKRQKTESTVNILQTALGDYKARFGRLPPIYGGPGWSAGPSSVIPSVADETNMVQGTYSGTTTSSITSSSTAHQQARNRAIRIYLETAWRGVREAPFIDSSSDIGRGDPVVSGIQLYVDAWGLPLVFNCPGQNHAFDKDADGLPITSRVDTSGRTTAGSETKWTFDIYSLGSNNVDDYRTHAANLAGTANDTHGDDVVSFGKNISQ